MIYDFTEWLIVVYVFIWVTWAYMNNAKIEMISLELNQQQAQSCNKLNILRELNHCTEWKKNTALWRSLWDVKIFLIIYIPIELNFTQVCFHPLFTILVKDQ